MFRVSERGVLPIEIHGIGDDKASVVEDNNVKEIIQLLQDAVRTHASSGRKTTDQSKQELKSGILTGNHVRVGYVFKKKPGHQICLIPATYITEPSNEKQDDELRSFQVLQEKVIVYAHLLCPGSPNKMSQLMKHVGDRRQSMGSGVSISSYFQRMSTHVSGTSQTGSTSTSSCHGETLKCESQSVGSVQAAPPSEGRRHKIKSIVSRADENASKRRHRKTVKSRESKHTVKSSKTSSVFELRSDTSSDEESSGARQLKQTCTSREESGTEHLKQMFAIKEESSGTEPFKPTFASREVGKLNLSSDDCDNEKKDIYQPIKCLEEEKENKICFGEMKVFESNTNTSVCEIKSEVSDTDERLSSSKGDQAAVGKASIRDTSINSVAEETSNSCIIGGMTITPVSVPALNMMPSDVTDAGSVTVISVEQMREIQDSTCSSDSQTDEAILPTASFRTRSYDTSSPKQSSDQGMRRQSSDMKSVNSLPKFLSYRSGDMVPASDLESNQSSPGRCRVSQDSENSEESCPKLSDLKTNLNRFQFKRKLPNFSDTDSDDTVPVTKALKIHTSNNVKNRKQKFVKPETSSLTSKKYTFTKYLSESDTKKQTKLSFFMNKGSVETCGDTEDHNDMDITLGLMEELSQTTRTKQHIDSSLKKEVAKLRSVKELNEEHLRYLTNENEKHLRKIFEGKLKCLRHDQYNQGGRSRRNLNYESGLGQFSDEQVDVVMEVLTSMFCKRHHKYLDYLMKVLLPEMLIKLHMDVHGTSHEESETILGHQPSSSP